jgi:hypothetical protein
MIFIVSSLKQLCDKTLENYVATLTTVLNIKH